MRIYQIFTADLSDIHVINSDGLMKRSFASIVRNEVNKDKDTIQLMRF